MNCNKCQELLSDYLANSLTNDEHVLLGKHLEDCLTCADVRTDINHVVTLASEGREAYLAPRDPQALWQRIREHVESDLEWAQATAATRAAFADATNPASVATATPTAERTPRTQPGFWSNLFGKRWELSGAQLTTGFATIFVVTALAAVVGIGALRETPLPAGANVRNGLASRQADVGGATQARSTDNLKEYLRQQQPTIEYWQQRATANKARLSPQMLDSYERTIGKYDQDVNYSLQQIQRNPEDQEVYQEMLDEALRGKVEVLKEFSEF